MNAQPSYFVPQPRIVSAEPAPPPPPQSPFIYEGLPPGEWVPITHAYRPASEDWMLQRVIADFQRVNTPFILVREKASPDIGYYVGVALYRCAWT